jgi:hypothetical protein
MSKLSRHLVISMTVAGALLSGAVSAQTGSDIGRPAAVIPIESEPPPRLVAYAPLPDPLARGVVIIQYRTENMRIIPVFGKNALDDSPRLGHLHVTVDDWPGTWAHTSGDPIILMGLKPGAHKILIELADPNHMIVASETMAVTVPEPKAPKPQAH